MTAPDVDTWEARMAERARRRVDVVRAADDRKRAEAGEAAAQRRQEAIAAGRPWLNGWPRIGALTVQMGTGVHCVCCGRCQGITCVAFPPDWEPPGPDPVWPFGQDDCPLCTRS